MNLRYLPHRLWSKVWFLCRWLCFYIRHGFSMVDIWSLDDATAKWILPRLKYHRANHHGYPGELTPEQWEEILDKMILAFDLVAKQWDDRDDTGDDAKIKEGMALFAEWFRALWD